MLAKFTARAGRQSFLDHFTLDYLRFLVDLVSFLFSSTLALIIRFLDNTDFTEQNSFGCCLPIVLIHF